MYLHFIFGFLSTLGFTVLYNTPKKHMIPASIIGGLGWITYKHFSLDSSLFACFLGALVVSLLSEILARFFKDAVTIFIIPGILSLVPGAGMYYTMLAVLESDFAKAANTGTNTIFMAGSIAVAILVISSFVRIFYAIKNYIKKKKHLS